VKLTTRLHLVPRSTIAWNCTSTPQYAFMPWCSVKNSTGTSLPLSYLYLWSFISGNIEGLRLCNSVWVQIRPARYVVCHTFLNAVKPGVVQEYLTETHNLHYLLTYLLTPWYRILFEKMIVTQLIKKISLFYGTRRFITVFTKARHCTLS
jgi:hypothetical protein